MQVWVKQGASTPHDFFHLRQRLAKGLQDKFVWFNDDYEWKMTLVIQSRHLYGKIISSEAKEIMRFL